MQTNKSIVENEMVTNEINKDELCQIILSILFTSGDGVSISDLCENLHLTEDKIMCSIDSIKQILNNDCGIQLLQYNGIIQLSSNPKYADFVSSVLNPIREKALTKAALETLAIIAYKQPITRIDLEGIRGVKSCDYAIQVLIEQEMIEIVGRKDAVGKPLLYGTTDKFLRKFSLESLENLPDQDEILSSLKTIKDERASGNGLYFDFKLSDEETPDFLDGEEIQKINSDEKIKGDNI